jgi:thiamine-phosphate pyrophosphorylase
MEMKAEQYKINGGIYLVIDPAMDTETLLTKLSAALTAGIQAVQIWDNWKEGDDRLSLITSIGQHCKHYGVPLLINEDWKLLLESEWLQGVHFDHVPNNLASIRKLIAKPFLTGITCSGNLDTVIWAHNNQLDYISFCAMFPSPSAGTCDIVMPATVKKARTLTAMPIFVSGGITPSNIVLLKKETPFDGVAVISGILSSENPGNMVKTYQDALYKH